MTRPDTNTFTPKDFIRESNRIEGIRRAPKPKEIEEYHRFMALQEVDIGDMIQFVKVYQPNALLRIQPGMNVRVGRYYPPQGGKQIYDELVKILKRCNRGRGIPSIAREEHIQYEKLHPFMDGNGRSGRMLWMWMMQEAPLGFLHHWYYQTLEGRP